MSDEMREAVGNFAQRMENTLRLYDWDRGQGGWACESIEFLVRRLQMEVAELVEACYSVPNTTTLRSPAEIRDAIVGEAVDVANFAMMIADNIQDPGRSLVSRRGLAVLHGVPDAIIGVVPSATDDENLNPEWESPDSPDLQ